MTKILRVQARPSLLKSVDRTPGLLCFASSKAIPVVDGSDRPPGALPLTILVDPGTISLVDDSKAIPGARSEGERMLVRQMYRELQVKPVYENPETPVYQYMSVETFGKILQSKVIWASDYRQLKDTREFIVGDELVLNVAREVAAEPDVNVARFLGAFIDNIEHLSFTKIMGQVFVASFSDMEDDVSLWDRYGGQGDGVCLGFRWRPPDSLEAAGGRRFGATMLKVQYDREIVRKTIRASLRAVAVGCMAYIGTYPRHRELLTNHGLLIAARATSYLVPAVKHATYRSEAERRIIAMPYTDAASELVRTREEDGRHFLEIPLAGGAGRLIDIRKVYIGWRGDAERRLAMIRSRLEEHGYDPGLAVMSEVRER